MSHHVLVAYYSHAGHTARIARTIMETIVAEGHACDMVDMMEAVREGVDWARYDIVIVGSPIVYGVYNKIVWEFCSMYKNEIESRPNSFFNVTVVAPIRISIRPKVTVICRSSSNAAPGNPARPEVLCRQGGLPQLELLRAHDDPHHHEDHQRSHGF